MRRIWISAVLLLLAALFATAVTAAEIPEQDRGEADDAVFAPEYPRLLSAAPASKGVRITWRAFPGAQSYRVFYRSGDEWIALGDADGTSFLHTTPINDHVYRYTVRAIGIDGDYCSDADREGLTLTYHSAPRLDSVANVYGGQQVSWSAVEGAALYKVFVRDGDGWRTIGTTDASSFTYVDVQPGESYTYTVRCVAEDGTQPQSDYDRTGVRALYVPSPAFTWYGASDGGNRLIWTASPGADHYCLYTHKEEGGWKRIAETAATDYTHSGLANDSTFTYTVRAFNASGVAVSGFDPVGVTLTYHSAPQLLRVVNVYGGQRVQWNAVQGAESYRVYLKDGDAWRVIGTTTDTDYLNTVVATGDACTYTVRCCSASGALLQSYYDRAGIGGVYYAAPDVIGFTPVSGGTGIAWSPVKGAALYRVFLWDGESWTRIGTTEDTSLIHRDPGDRCVCTYTVRAMNSAGAYISGYRPDGWQHCYYAPPAAVQVSYEDGAYTVLWERAADVGGYRLYRRALGEGWQELCTFEGRGTTSYVDRTAEPDVPYTYSLCYLDEEDLPLSAYLTDTLYYLNGALAEGELLCGGDPLYFVDGHIRQGYVTVDGRLYYYNSSGVLLRSGIVGSEEEGYTVADENGVCCTTQEIRMAAQFMMTRATGDTLDEKMKSGYLYLAHQFPYNRTYDHPSRASDMPALAIDMFTNEKGNCYRYAACFACIAKIAGYRARVVIGSTVGNPHGWVEVLVDGVWLICDPDADIPKYNNPDYTAYMMKQHYWQITPKTRCEIVIDENGVATWI